MGLLSRFGVGGGDIDIALENSVVVPGGELKGNVLWKGGKRDQEISSIKLTAYCSITYPPTVQGGQPQTTQQTIVPEREVCGKISVKAGETRAFPFSLTIPQGLYGTTPQRVAYRLHSSADIDKEVDPGDSQEFVVQGPPPPAVAPPVAATGGSPPLHASGSASSGMVSGAHAPAPTGGGGAVPAFAIGAAVWGRYLDGNWYPGKVMGVQPGLAIVTWSDTRMGATAVQSSGLRSR